ncbi:hypothetical protein SAMN05428961_110114 [Paenibacillus sp. OK060]|uniref:hypothetical protein n=1 Tax=Paenibacillus sp. OK060 TaxID=1881034 RepID=UPI00087FE083|nr:hypothetical protein [Paenibacillus sp. OK060]SDM16085.1 hypothetical protein SAMN05428961_110114 [Paenibacillus sp. OK060]
MKSGLEKEQQHSNRTNLKIGAMWSNFRDRMSLIHNRLNEIRPTYGGKALLIGAGNGYDLPLSQLEANYESIVVVDIDTDSFKELLKQVSCPEKFKFVHVDVSGVGSQIPSLRKLTELEIIQMIDKLEYRDEWTNKLEGSFDFIMTCHLTTQLVSPFFMMEMLAMKGNISWEYNMAVNRLSERVINGLFQSISTILSKEGLFFHSTDTFELSYNESTDTWRKGSEEILKAANFNIDFLHEVPSLVYTDLISKGYHITGSTLPDTLFETYEKLPYNYISPWQFSNEGSFLKTYVVFSYPFILKAES